MDFGEALSLYVAQTLATWGAGIVAIIMGLALKDTGSDIYNGWKLRKKNFKYNPFFYIGDQKYKVEDIRFLNTVFWDLSTKRYFEVTNTTFIKKEFSRRPLETSDFLNGDGTKPTSKSTSR